MEGMRARGIITAVALLATVASVSGCARRGAIRNGRRLARYEANLTRSAARDSGCSPVQVRVFRVSDTVWEANTCTGPREYFLRCSRHHRWAGCRWEPIATVQEASAPVLGCPPTQIGQQVAGPSLRRFVTGCGRQVAMSLLCNGIGCGWAPETPPTSLSRPYVPPPPPVGYGQQQPPQAYPPPPVVYVPGPQQ